MLIYSYIFLKIDSKSKTNINIDINKNETYGLFINYKQFCIYVDATALQKWNKIMLFSSLQFEL